MLLSNVNNISKKFLDIILKTEGISTLYPPQEHAIKSGVLEGKNLILATPTASGKTLVAELAISKILDKNKKAVYVVPLRALAYEKFLDFKKYKSLGYKVRLEMGDLDSSKYSKHLDFDILVTTAEKLDSILRSRTTWLKDVGILVMDEIHMISTDRGPVYEIIIAKFQSLFPKIQILALSATIGNAGEMAEWLKAGLVESEWRPVKLVEKAKVGKKFDQLKEIIRKEISEGGQVLVFVNSRRSAEALAEKLGEELNLGRKDIGDIIAEKLEKISIEILNSLSTPTRQCKRLSLCVKNGTAFHHAGEVNKQRILVEDSFKEGLIKVIVATPTLAFGINLPSRVVVIRDIKRYGHSGYCDYIPVLEYKQMIGRAGRPKYDSIGKALLLAKDEDEKDFLMEKYINGEIEKINSRLGVEPVLRFHVLAAVASQFSRTKESLMNFFKRTFFSYQYGLIGFEEKIFHVLKQLQDWNFIRNEGKGFLFPTKLGARISELYIDPQTAHKYISLLKIAEKERKKFSSSIGLLEMLCDAVEMPLLRLRREEELLLWEDASKVEEQLLRNLDDFDLDYNFLERFKTAKLFHSWIKEISEDLILEKYKVAPGILHQKLQIAEWLAYSASEIAKILKFKNSERELRKLEIRIKNGIKEELIPLIHIRGIGRVRARKLFDAGLKKPSDVKKASLQKVSRLIGKKTAEKVKKEIRTLQYNLQ
jgi:helicase